MVLKLNKLSCSGFYMETETRPFSYLIMHFKYRLIVVVTSGGKASLWHSQHLFRWRTIDIECGKGSGLYTHAQVDTGLNT